VNIVMLGHTNAGKTTYMALMYRAMATEGVSGFRIRAQDEQHHRQLLTAGNGILRGQYPRPSDRRDEYPLSLRHAASPLIDFSWKDYRGGALRDLSTALDTSQMLDDLKAADAIILFFDSVDLQRSQVARQKVRDLTTIVYRTLQDRTQPTPIVITLTKSDLVDLANRDRRLEPFESFIVGLSGQASVIGTVIEVACGPQPQNVMVPVLFCLYFGLTAKAAVLYRTIVQTTAKAEALRARDNLWDRMRSAVTGEETYRNLSDRAYRRAFEEYQSLEPLIGPIERLQYMLGEISVFGGVADG
jgi:GTPase SAR1 family protein